MKPRFILVNLVIILGIVGLFYVQKLMPVLKHNNAMYILSSVSTENYYEQKTDNTMICDLQTYTNIILNMLKDDYEIYREFRKSDGMDFILVKDDNTVRIVYDSNGNCTSISSPYERSYVAFTYINVK